MKYVLGAILSGALQFLLILAGAVVFHATDADIMIVWLSTWVLSYLIVIGISIRMKQPKIALGAVFGPPIFIFGGLLAGELLLRFHKYGSSAHEPAPQWPIQFAWNMKNGNGHDGFPKVFHLQPAQA
jgi:hypothetical protein